MSDLVFRRSGLVCLASASIVALICCGCGGSASSDVAGGDTIAVPGGMSEASGPDAPPGEAADVAAGVQAPAKANFTLFCRAFTGPNHALVAQRVKEQIQEASKLDDFYLVTGDSRTALYHGFYETFDESVDAEAADRAQGDRRLIERLVDADGSRIFTRTVFEPLERPDPTAPPEWDLQRASGYWTLLVATYTEDAQRKQAAVETVREMRKNGIEAYYLHKGPQSHVLIGTWPATAVQRQQGIGQANNPTDLADPETLVVGMTELDPDFKKLVDHRGRPVKILQVKVEPVDPSLQKAMAEYEYSVNGYRPSVGQQPAALIEIHKATNREDPLKAPALEGPKADELEKLLQRPF